MIDKNNNIEMLKLYLESPICRNSSHFYVVISFISNSLMYSIPNPLGDRPKIIYLDSQSLGKTTQAINIII